MTHRSAEEKRAEKKRVKKEEKRAQKKRAEKKKAGKSVRFKASTQARKITINSKITENSKTTQNQEIRKPAILIVPPEVHSMICGLLSPKSLKKARRASKIFASHCEKYLFETVVLWKTKEDWVRLANICKSPRLASVLAHLQLVQIENLPRYDLRENYIDAVPDRFQSKSSLFFPVAGVKLTPPSGRTLAYVEDLQPIL